MTAPPTQKSCSNCNWLIETGTLDKYVPFLGGSYSTENVNRPIVMVEIGKSVYISAYFGHKKCDGNEKINLQGH